MVKGRKELCFQSYTVKIKMVIMFFSYKNKELFNLSLG